MNHCRDHLMELCWDCHRPLGEVVVRVEMYPGLGVNTSTVGVCAECAKRREEATP